MTEKGRYITKPCPCILLIPQTRVYRVILFYPEHRLWILVRTASACTHNQCFSEKIRMFIFSNFTARSTYVAFVFEWGKVRKCHLLAGNLLGICKRTEDLCL